MDLGATEWQAFRRVTLPALLPGIVAAAMLALHGFLRRLRDHQHGGGRGFRDAADGDLRHGAARRQSRRSMRSRP